MEKKISNKDLFFQKSSDIMKVLRSVVGWNEAPNKTT